ncbi:HD domain-containing phosphohydrolase [Geotalea toluenoxydans]
MNRQLFYYLHSIVARRILGLFVLCAMLPTATLGIFTLSQVADKLREQAHERLHQASKNVAMTIVEGLTFLKSEMEELAASRGKNAGLSHLVVSKQGGNPLHQRFLSLAILQPNAETKVIFGKSCPLPPLNEPILKQLSSGKAFIYAGRTDSPTPVFIAIAIGRGTAPRFLVGEINPDYLWERVSDALPPLTEAAIIDSAGTGLYCSPLFPSAAIARFKNGQQPAFGQYELPDGADTHLANYRSIFLRGAFLTDDWTVVVTQSRTDAFMALTKFARTFILILVLTLLVVCYLSSVQIRRSLVPLARLKEGTRHISRGDFASRIEVNSGDEFEEVADSFNIMAEHLRRQFETLSGTGQIVRTILTALERKKIIAAVVNNMQSVIGCDQVALFLLEPGLKDTAIAYHSNAGGENPAYTVFPPDELDLLEKTPESLLVGPGEFSGLLSTVGGGGLMAHALLPIRLHQNIGGILVLGYREKPDRPQEDLLRARQIADQIAVAIVNADLIDELAQLSWGTLTALARAVDANSPWTAGHSERVTELSLRIGKAMGLSPQELQLLHQGGLLHDIGKISVPGSVLDKPGKLTEEEFALIREHPAKGALILEPIPPYREVIPLVEQHHEWFNGEGYPLGLAGEAISLGARILAVADVYDALLSDRPYRPGWESHRVLAYIEERAGHQFDPAVVEAFLTICGDAVPA